MNLLVIEFCVLQTFSYTKIIVYNKSYYNRHRRRRRRRRRRLAVFTYKINNNSYNNTFLI